MLISTKGEYGFRAMLVLAAQYAQGPVPLRAIAEREQLSEHYLEHLFRDLRANELVTSYRGAKGGYRLARPPAEITVGDVLWALEGSLAPMQCVAGASDTTCRHKGSCTSIYFWQKLKAAMDEVLDSTSLADVLTGATKE